MPLYAFLEMVRDYTIKEYKGIPGIMELYHCSESTAKRYKKRIEAAVTYHSPRRFTTDPIKAMLIYPPKVKR